MSDYTPGTAIIRRSSLFCLHQFSHQVTEPSNTGCSYKGILTPFHSHPSVSASDVPPIQVLWLTALTSQDVSPITRHPLQAPSSGPSTPTKGALKVIWEYRAMPSQQQMWLLLWLL